tara:strand:- start:828 stop:2273 length:1446 start_codon:yes stop_codon:yes gene_type:complete
MPFLTELIAACRDEVTLHGADISVTGMTADSRQVSPGMLFAAIPGVKLDGAKFIAQAKEKGAAAVLAQNPHPELPTLVSNNIRRSVAEMARACYPQMPEYIMAVTGTNGKTSVADFYRQLWEVKHRAASIGTLGLLGVPAALEAQFPAVNTSPDPILLAQMLQAIAQHKIEHVAMEASSHGLHQHRLDGVPIDTAVFTNLTQDHLDYHGDMEQYFLAKARLFTDFPLSHAVINADDANGQRLQALVPHLSTMTYGVRGKTCRLFKVEPVVEGLAVHLSLHGEIFEDIIPLYGRFQMHNIAAALCAVVAQGMPVANALQGIAHLQGVSGRMERVALHPNAAPMFIDYAHTPDALEQVLTSLRAHCTNHLHVVFGCGGDRDTTKRALMGSVAEKLADNIIITDDNPRTENAAGIRAQILAGIKEKRVTQIPDRREAIRAAVHQLSEDDILVVAGKGHEAYQIIGDQTYDFNDKAELLEAVKTL